MHGSSHSPVVLASMPFGPVRVPSIGLSLLKASLPPGTCSVLYFTIDYAEQIGDGLYTRLSLGSPASTALTGEWIFRPALFDDRPDEVERYVEAVLGPEADHAGWERDRDRILAARSEVRDFVDRCAERIERLRPRIVGFTSVFQQQMATLALARRLKSSADAPFVVLGGANCEGPMGRELVRRLPFVDAAVSGEADTVFADLVRRVSHDRDVDDLPGVLTAANVTGTNGDGPRAPSRISNLDDLPFPDYDDYFRQWQASSLGNGDPPRLLFETSRGCWWGEKQHCTFCGLNGSTMVFRSKSAERALAELEHLVERYPGHRVQTVDNILDMRYFREFLPQLARRDLGVELFYEVKANLRKQQLQQLRSAGVTEIQPGIESLSDDVLRLMRKGVTGLQNIQLLKWCVELGIWPAWHLIWGFPGEPPAEYRRMAEWIPLLSHLPPPHVAIPIRLDRFSPNYEQSDALGFRDVEPFAAYRQLYPFPEEALANLAYYFTYGYEDGRDVEAYTAPLARRVGEWQRTYEKSELFCVDKGDSLWIWDLRPMARQALFTLHGADRQVYLACDEVRRIEALSDVARDVEARIAPLVAAGLMLRHGGKVLSLAVQREGGRHDSLEGILEPG